MKVYLIFKKTGDINILLGVGTTPEERDRIIKEHYEKQEFPSDVGKVWVKVVETGKLIEYDIVYRN